MIQTKRFQNVWGILTLIGVAVYIAKSLYFAHSSLSIGDEGAYLFKGLMFVRGEHRPFQEYGFWTNKAPLAFLIPGYAQLLFGAGLRAARYFAVSISLLMLVGLWITSHRLGGRGWAALAVWVFALSDAHVATYSLALSQGLVACMMSWMFVCTLGEDRPMWQLVLGSVLSVLVVMTRQNMVVVPPILILYIFWQYGSRVGWWVLATGIAIFIAFHAFYWPGILQLWSMWLPAVQTPFLDNFRIIGTSTGTFRGSGVLAQWQAFAIGIRDHFFVLCGFVGGVILWVRMERWKNPMQFRTATFLGILFLSLFLMHMWGSLFNDFCALCFTSYQMFFSMTGFLFVLVVFSNGISESKYRFPLLALILLFFSALLGLAYFPVSSDWLLDSVQLPRISAILADGSLDFASLRDVLTYVLQMETDLQKRIASALGGVLAGGILLVIAWNFFQRPIAVRRAWGYSVNRITVSIFMFAGMALPALLDLGKDHSGCSTDFLTYYEQAGRTLAEIVPPNSLVYWKGSGRQLALLLYADEIQYFPPQISAGAGYLIGDSDHLLKFGLYNETLDRQWREAADIFLIWRFFPTIEFEEFLDQTQYATIPFELGSLLNCEDQLYVYKKLP